MSLERDIVVKIEIIYMTVVIPSDEIKLQLNFNSRFSVVSKPPRTTHISRNIIGTRSFFVKTNDTLTKSVSINSLQHLQMLSNECTIIIQVIEKFDNQRKSLTHFSLQFYHLTYLPI